VEKSVVERDAAKEREEGRGVMEEGRRKREEGRRCGGRGMKVLGKREFSAGEKGV